MDNPKSNSFDAARNEDGSAANPVSDDNKNSPSRTRQELQTGDLESACDSVIFSNSGISDLKLESAVDDDHPVKTLSELRSGASGASYPAKSQFQEGQPKGYLKLGESAPTVAWSNPKSSRAMKVPRNLIRSTNHRSGQGVKASPSSTKRRGPTIDRQLHKRHRKSTEANQERFQPDVWSSDSDSEAGHVDEPRVATNENARQVQKQETRLLSQGSTSSTASIRKLRSNDDTTSLGAHLRSRLVQASGDEDQTAKTTGIHRARDTTVACESPMLPRPDMRPIESFEAAVLSILISNPNEIGTLMESPAAWGLTGTMFSEARLVKATLQPHTSRQWQLTATFSQPPNVRSARHPKPSFQPGNPSANSDSSSSSIDSIHHYSSESESEPRTRRTRRGGWEEEDDKNLINWKRLDKPWSWIVKQFPDRTEGALKSRWYVVLAPQEKLKR